MNDLFKKIDKILFESSKNMLNPVINQDLGVLIYFATRFKINKETRYKKKCIYLLDKFITGFNDYEFSIGLFDGFEGVFLTIEYLEKCKIIKDSSFFLESIEENLYQSIAIDIEDNMIEVFYGSIGKIQYFLDVNKIKEDKIFNLINQLVNSLWENKKGTNGEIYWGDKKENDESVENINLGMAHGICSILIFVVKLKELQFNNSHLDDLIYGLIKTFKNAENEIKINSFFPSVYNIKNKDLNVINNRRAYCIGDLPISYALCRAGRIMHNNDWLEYSKLIVEKNIDRTPLTSSVHYFESYDYFDIGFCHGISSILFLFYKINKYHQNDFIDSNIEYWKRELITNVSKFIKIKGTIHNLCTYNKSGDEISNVQNSFLHGLCGAALTLLSIEYDETEWSTFLCLN